MLKLNYFLADIFILSAEKQPIKLSWRKIEWLHLIKLKGGGMYKFNHKLLDLFDKKQDSNPFLFRKQNPFMTISVTYIF